MNDRFENIEFLVYVLATFMTGAFFGFVLGSGLPL